jgi:glucose-1-phosphate thymidylyltransferase
MNVPEAGWRNAAVPCVVMCGGRSSRFASVPRHKSMATVAGVPLLEHVLRPWLAYTSRFIFVVKNGKEDVIALARTLPVDAEFVEPDALRGIANGLSFAEPLVRGRFILVLGDCFHTGVFEAPGAFEAGVGVLPGAPAAQISQNFGVHVSGDQIVRVLEKPTVVDNDLCGTGFYFLPEQTFAAIRTTGPSARTGEVEITDVLQTLIDQGVALRPLWLRGAYVNVTRPEDLTLVEHLLAADHGRMR